MSKTVPQPIDPEFHEEVGRLCAAWAYLEMRIEQKIWSTLSITEEIGAYITQSLDARRRWEMLIEVLKSKNAPEYEIFKEKNKIMRDLIRDRNLIVHGLVAWSYEAEQAVWIVPKGAYAGTPTPATKEFVIKIREEIQALAHFISGRKEVLGPA